jgi:hemoglobin/transferrin/lactoferrin receptor protein
MEGNVIARLLYGLNETYRFKSQRHCLGAAVLLVMLFIGLPASLFAQPVTKPDIKQYDIAPGALGPALEQFSRGSGINIFYDDALMDGVRTKGLKGLYSVETGLEILLNGTGIIASKRSGGWILKPKTAPASSTQEPEVLDQPPRSDPNASQNNVEMPALVVRDISDTETISLEQVNRNLASDVSDLFDATPSVVVGGGGRNAQRIYLRGIESTNLNMTIDGARQGRALFQHHGSVGGLDPSMLKQVEVQTMGNADQGPGALGGSISFETLDAQDLLQPGRVSGARLKTGYSSVDDTTRGSAEAYALLKDHLGLLAHVSGANRDDYENGDGRDVLNTAGDDRDYLFKISMLDWADHSLRLSAQKNTATGNSNWGGSGSDMGEASDTESAVYQEVERISYTLDHRYTPKANSLIDWKFNFYSNTNSLENVDAGNTVDTMEYGGSAKNTFSFELGPTRHHLTAAMDYFNEDGTYDDGDEEISNGSDNFGLALQERINVGRFGISMGARFDDYASEYGSETVSGNEVSPNISAEIEIITGLSLFGGYSEAVRGSSIIPIQWLSMIEDDVEINNGNGVEPEESNTRQAGIRYARSGLFWPEDHVRAEATYFNTRLTNTIEVESGGQRGQPITAIYNNPDTLTSKGYEVNLTWAIKQFRTRLAFSSFETEDGDGNPAGIIRRKTAASGDQLVWDLKWDPKPNLTFGYTLTYVADLTKVPEGENERSGYILHAVQASWQPKAIEGLTLSLAVDNLFDKYYCNQTSIEGDYGAISEPGRDIRLAVSYQF